MKLSIICFSLTGLETASRLKTEFEKQGHRVLLASKSKYLKGFHSGICIKMDGKPFFC